jgi:hypothetical protein
MWLFQYSLDPHFQVIRNDLTISAGLYITGTFETLNGTNAGCSKGLKCGIYTDSKQFPIENLFTDMLYAATVLSVTVVL